MSFCQFSPEWAYCEIVNTVIAIIGLIITTTLGIHGIQRICKLKKIRKMFKSLFICAAVLSYIILSSVIIASILCSQSLLFESFIFQVFIVVPYHLLALTLSLTLYVVYGLSLKTHYKMNKYYLVHYYH